MRLQLNSYFFFHFRDGSEKLNKVNPIQIYQLLCVMISIVGLEAFKIINFNQLKQSVILFKYIAMLFGYVSENDQIVFLYEKIAVLKLDKKRVVAFRKMTVYFLLVCCIEDSIENYHSSYSVLHGWRDYLLINKIY